MTRWPGAWWAGLAGALSLAALLRFASIDTVPPGLHYDEAAYGLQALDLRREPRLELFFPAFTGREPLFLYLLAAALYVGGESTTVLRATVAVIGVGAVWTTALAGRALFGPGVGLLGAALLAGSFWHLMFSRQAYRLSLLTTLAPLAVWLLWRARERPSIARGALAGVATGLLAYTYVTARLLIAALFLWLAVECLLALKRDRSRLDPILAAGVAALLIISPLAAYFARHPESFAVRFDQAATRPGLGPVLDTLGMYGLRGDAAPKFNLPMRPALDLPLAALFAGGVVILAWRISDSRSRLLLGWLLGALASGFITLDSPNFGRLNAAAPPSYLAAAFAFVGATRRLPLRGLGPLRTAPIPLLLAGALVLVEAGLSARDYFVRWAPSAETYAALHGDLAALGTLAARMPPDVPMYASSEHYRHPTVAFVAGAAFERLRWFDGRAAFPVPPPGSAARYLIPASAAPPRAELSADIESELFDPGGAPAASSYRRAVDAPAPTAAIPVGVRFAFGDAPSRPIAELVAYDAPSPVRAGDAARVRAVWRLLIDRPARTPDFFVHLVDAAERRWGQRDRSPYLASEWRAGELLIVWLDVVTDPTSPAGPTRMRLGLNDPAAGRALEARRADGSVVPGVLEVAGPTVGHRGEVDLERFLAAAPPGARRFVARRAFASLELTAATWPPEVEAGRPADVDLYWLARADAPRGESRLILRNGGVERVVSARELDSLDASSPWRSGSAQRDARRWTPTRSDAGTWTLVVAVDGQEQDLGQIVVSAPPAAFDLPTPGRPLSVELDGVAELLGVDLTDREVVVYWKARGPTERSLTVFVHALGPNGEIKAQHDAVPAGGGRPTTGWAPDEVVTDRHPLRLPDDWSALAIGLYDPTTGARVPSAGGGDHVRLQR